MLHASTNNMGGGKEQPFHFFQKIGGPPQFLEKNYSNALRGEYMGAMSFLPILYHANHNMQVQYNIQHDKNSEQNSSMGRNEYKT